MEECDVHDDPRGIKPKGDRPTQVGSHFDGKKICKHKIGKRRRDREASYLKKRSTTDPDATLQYRPGTGCMLSYKAHIAADSSGVITAVCVSPSALNDSAKTPELIEKHERLLGTPAWIAADSKYGNQECLGYLQSKGIKTVIEPSSTNNRPGYFSKDIFIYDAKADSFICPAGKMLKRKCKNHHTNQIMYIAKKNDCTSCRLRSKCIEPHRNGSRSVSRFDNDYFKKAKNWCNSPMGRRLYILRKTVIEGLFGDAKAHHGLSRAKLRRLNNIEIQLLLTATVLNLKKLFRKMNTETAKETLRRAENILQKFYFAISARFLFKHSVCWV